MLCFCKVFLFIFNHSGHVHISRNHLCLLMQSTKAYNLDFIPPAAKFWNGSPSSTFPQEYDIFVLILYQFLLIFFLPTSYFSFVTPYPLNSLCNLSERF